MLFCVMFCMLVGIWCVVCVDVVVGCVGYCVY